MQITKYYKFTLNDAVLIALIPLLIFGNSFGITIFYNAHYLMIVGAYGAYIMLGVFTSIQKYNAEKLGMSYELSRINNFDWRKRK